MLRRTPTTRILANAVFAFFCFVLTSVSQAGAGFPASQRVCLSDGRWLEYAEYGDPSGPLVLYFHGTPGSHLEVQAGVSDIEAAGIHVLAINRPGIGRSSYQCGRRILDWPEDMAEFLEVLGRGDEPFGIVAFSGGAPYALACARTMPQRVTRVALVSGHTALGIPGVAPGEADRSIRLFLRRPKLAKKVVAFSRRRLLRRPNKLISRVTKNWDPNDRRLVACDPSVRRLLERSLRHATLCGARGVVTDAQLLGRRWGFDLADVSGPPISVWHGQCDRIAPISMGHYFHSQLVGSTLHVDPRAGHITMFKWHSEEIHQEFARQ